jgi:hypothetical protein
VGKEICSNCNAKLSQPASFCPNCSRPTSHASESELIEWDLRQWRKHVDRSVESGSSIAASLPLRSAAGAVGALAVAAPEVAPLPSVRRAPQIEAPARARRKPRAEKTPGHAGHSKEARKAERRVRRVARRAPPRESTAHDRVIVLDADHEFVYTSCTSCERGDWIVRTTRNEDETYNYWCVRCSRGFKSDARLRHGIKPFLASGSVIGALAALSILMR